MKPRPRNLKDDPYSEFAEFYDLFHERFGEFQDGSIEVFFRDLFESRGVHRVLDCACGTAQHLPLFCSLGCEVVGSDISDAMLARARGNLASRGLGVSLVKADFRELHRHFADPFDAVVCLGTSLPHLLERSDVVKMLENTRRVLRPKGPLVISQGISDRTVREKPLLIPVITGRDFSRVFGMEYGARSVKIHVLDMIHTEKGQESRQYGFEYQILLQDDYRRLLDEAGYRDIEFFADYRATPYSKQTSDRMIVVALG